MFYSVFFSLSTTVVHLFYSKINFKHTQWVVCIRYKFIAWIKQFFCNIWASTYASFGKSALIIFYPCTPEGLVCFFYLQTKCISSDSFLIEWIIVKYSKLHSCVMPYPAISYSGHRYITGIWLVHWNCHLKLKKHLFTIAQNCIRSYFSCPNVFNISLIV